MTQAEQVSHNTILMAEDDPDDRFFVEQALLEIGNGVDVRFVGDGEELMDYLLRSGKHADATSSPRPMLIFLDLNMPRKDGRQALREIKTDPDLKKIPVVIWTTSEEVGDRIYCREAGAEAYVIKPPDYSELVDTVKQMIKKYCSQEPMADTV